MESTTIYKIYDKIIENFLRLPMITPEVLNMPIYIPDERIPEVTLRPDGDKITSINRPEYRVIADFQGTKGEAYTECPCGFEGTLKEALDIRPTDNGISAATIASINAAMSHFGHFKGIFPDDPAVHQKYAKKLCIYVSRNFGRSNIVLVGYDGYIVKTFVESGIDFWTIDRNPENISRNLFQHIVVNSGKWNRESAFAWGKVFLITGSTLCNGTITQYLGRGIEQGRQILFYGITAAGPMKLLGLPWFATDCIEH